MPVRKTESRIPENSQASDLGQALVADDGRCALVSFITSPLVVNHENVYVLIVTDAGLAAAAQSFEWTFTESGGALTSQITEHGEFSYTPQSTGDLNIAVRILDASSIEQAKIEIVQEVNPLNAELEELIISASNESGPGVLNPDVARELINDYNPYYQTVTLQTPEAGDGFQRFLFSLVFDGALGRNSTRRKQHLDQLVASLNDQTSDFATLAAEGVGVCNLRLTLLAMTFGTPSPLLDWTELPETTPQRSFAYEQLCQQLAALDEEARIDLLNLARFPKSNITQCGRIIETLRDRYFNGKNFNDVLTGMSGVRAQRIIRHFREGPLLRS
jgi:hypothetical protein